MSRKDNKSIKVKKNIEPCPCPKETFKNSNKNSDEISLIENFNNVDNSLKNFFGNSKLVIGENNYLLKNYRWLIIAFVIGLIILIAFSYRTDSTPSVTPGIIPGVSVPMAGLISTGAATK